MAVVYVQNNEKDLFSSDISVANLQPHQKVIPVFGPMKETYLINILRNIGIAAVKTSHLLLVDVDNWTSGRRCYGEPSSDTLYQNLLKLPKARLEQDNLAIVLPLFTIPQGGETPVLTDCVNMYEALLRYYYRYPQYTPRNVEILRSLIRSSRSFPYIPINKCPISSMCFLLVL